MSGKRRRILRGKATKAQWLGDARDAYEHKGVHRTPRINGGVKKEHKRVWRRHLAHRHGI